MSKQTYANYYKNYFKTPSGRQSLDEARRRYRTKLLKLYPGVGINRAIRMHAQERKQKLNTEGGDNE